MGWKAEAREKGAMSGFSDIFGQESAIEALTNAYASERLPHGLIFAGPIGVGKATTAGALAMLFLCEKPRKTDPCGKCDSCRAMSAGTHPDYHIIYRQLIRELKKESVARDLAIDVIREYLVGPAGRTTVMGVGKVFVIEEAELMNAAAQNTMLKTLEEPAGRTLIVLLTDQPGSLLPTIRSRCQMIRFQPLDEKTVKVQLKQRGISASQSDAAAHLTEGSLGLALRWIDDGVVDASAELLGRLEDMIDHKPWPQLQKWFKDAAEAYAAKQHEKDEKCSKDQATREGLAIYLRIAAEHVRRILPTVGDPETLEQLASAIDAFHATEQNLDSNVNVSLALQQLNVELERVLIS